MKSVLNSSFIFLFSLIIIFVSWSTLLSSHRGFVVVAFSLNSEEEALLSLVNTFTPASVPDSIKLSWNFSTSSTPCEWFGITCNTQNTHVVSLNLNHSGIYGQLGPQIGQLRYLKSLDLSGNNFTGPIPIELWNCSHLQRLDLSVNNFTGELPETVRNLHQLDYFDISNNQLNGRIPESLFEIPGLVFVYAHQNNFSGSIPVNIGNATNLMILMLFSNRLHGNIPTSLANCTRLFTLQLNNNGLSGEIPPGVWRIPTIKFFLMNDNNLSGELPLNMTELSVLDMSGNNIHGKIPWSICNLISSLSSLDFSDNNMNGTLPQCLGDFNQLYILNLRNNDFSGTLPLEFTSSRLYRLDLNGNRFVGKIPRIHSPRLTYLDLGNNQLNDTFPFFLGEILSDLEILVLHSNKLYGTLKPLHTYLTFNQLKVLDISSNYFTGDLPLEIYLGLEAMKHINNVEYIDNQDYIRYPPIRTVIIHKGKETTLNRTFIDKFRAIDMSNNKLQGTIPESIGELVWLKMLNLSSNNLIGHIPSSLGNLTQLESLDLSHNKLSGEIPRHLTDIQSLGVFNISHNNLTGRIPNGRQFQTFPNDSFSGNHGLCGLPLSTKCEDDANKESNQDPIEEKESDEDSKAWNFGWEPVAIGYGCGIVIGLVIQYFVFTKTSMYRWFG